MSLNNVTPKKVCIIGAGPNGLVAARHLSENSPHELTIFEAKSDLGGLWHYEEKNATDPAFDVEKRHDKFFNLYGCFQGSIYSTLKTNIPYYLMSFKDLDHADIDENIPTFITMDKHIKYLRAYAEKFNLRRHMIFNTLVQSVRLYKNLSPEEQAQAPENRKFVVKTSPSMVGVEGRDQIHSFDHVIVCSGINTKPNIPKFKGQEKFAGQIFSSKCYRRPDSEEFKGKTIVIYGGSYSAIDLLIQFLANPVLGPQDVKKILYVGRNLGAIKEAEDWREHMESGKLEILEGEIKEFLDEKSIKFSNNAIREVDTVVTCCGYQLCFPFFDLEKDDFFDFNPNEHNGKYIGSLYKRMFAVREPNLVLLCGTDLSLVGCYISESQAMITRQVIDGNLKLPSQEVMMKGFEADVNEILAMGEPLRRYFTMPRDNSGLDFAYWRDLRNWLKTILPSDEEKAERFIEAMMKIGDIEERFFYSGNFISYKEFDFTQIHNPKELKNNSDFV